MVQRRAKGKLLRTAVSAVLAGAMALGSLPGTVGTALAATVTISEPDGGPTTAMYDVYQILEAGSVDPTTYVVQNPSWKDSATEAVVKQVVTTYSSKYVNFIDYYLWLQNEGIIAGWVPATTAEIAAAEEDANIIAFLAAEIADDERNGSSINVDPAALPDLDGAPVKVTNPESFANVLAKALETSTTVNPTTTTADITDPTKSAGAFTASTEGFYLIVPQGDTTGATPIFAPIGGSDVSVALKRGLPSINKLLALSESSLPTLTEGKMADRAIGTATTFYIDVTIPAETEPSGIEKFEVLDLMPAGMTFTGASDVVISVDGALYTAVAPAVTENKSASTITFNLLDIAKAQTKKDVDQTIRVQYNALLNEYASIGASDPNSNVATLTYKLSSTDQERTTASTSTDVLTYEIDLAKVDAASGDAIPDAGFTIMNNSTSRYLQADGSEGLNPYTFTTDALGNAVVQHLDEGTYTLSEVSTPSGYKALVADITMDIVAKKSKDGTITSLKASASGGNGDVKAKAVFDEGRVYLTIPNEKDDDIALPITGMRTSQIMTIVGVLIVIGSAVGIARYRRSEQE